MIGVCGEPQCLCKQVFPPAPVARKAPADCNDPRLLSDHELRWALRDGISVMYRHLGLELKEEK